MRKEGEGTKEIEVEDGEMKEGEGTKGMGGGKGVRGNDGEGGRGNEGEGGRGNEEEGV